MRFSFLLLSVATALSAPELKQNADYSLSAPFKSSAMRSRWSWTGDEFAVRKAAITLTTGKSSALGCLYHRYHFFHDDFLEVRAEVSFTPTEGGGPNAFIVQLAPLQTVYDGPGTELVLTGLAVIVVGPTADGGYFATHRHFHREATLSPDYLATLSPRAGEGCRLGRIADIDALRLQIDFEAANRIEVLFEERGRPFSCFAVEAQMQYVAARAFYLSFKAVATSGLGVALRGVGVREKAHSFDVSDELLVSHGLVEEVFDKVAAFNARLGANRARLGDVAALQRAVLREGERLDAYARDLFFGTKKFQEFLLETLADRRLAAPESFPKMEAIRAKIAALTAKQRDFYDAFTALRALLATRRTLRATQKQLESVQTQISEIAKTVASPRFAETVERAQKLIAPLNSISFSEMLDAVLGAEPTANAARGIVAANAIVGIVAFAALSVFGVLIVRKIGSFESRDLV